MPETESAGLMNSSPPPPPPDFAIAQDGAVPRLRLSLVVSLIGLLIFMIGTKPAWFGWDRSPVVGFVQIAVFLTGFALICLGGYIGLLTLWWGRERTIVADIGSRLIATGYVVTTFAGMADVFGMGSHSMPKVPHFGPLQASGVLVGQGFVAAGFLLMLPHRIRRFRARAGQPGDD